MGSIYFARALIIKIVRFVNITILLKGIKIKKYTI